MELGAPSDRCCNADAGSLAAHRLVIRSNPAAEITLANKPGICAGLIANMVQVLSNGQISEDSWDTVGSDSDIAKLARQLRINVLLFRTLLTRTMVSRCALARNKIPRAAFATNVKPKPKPSSGDSSRREPNLLP